jgi:hypothetical protein
MPGRGSDPDLLGAQDAGADISIGQRQLMMPGGVAIRDPLFRQMLGRLIGRLRPTGQASGLDVGISARLCRRSHLGPDNEPEHIDVRLKLRRTEAGPAIDVLEVGIDGPQPLVALNHFDGMTVDFRRMPSGVFLEMVAMTGEPIRIRAGDRLTVRLRLSTGITAVSEVVVGPEQQVAEPMPRS